MRTIEHTFPGATAAAQQPRPSSLPPSDIFGRTDDSDGLSLAETRWKLRRAVRVLNETFAELSVENIPTRPSSVVLSVASLGYHFAPNDSDDERDSGSTNQTNKKQISLTPAPSAIGRMPEKLSQLYEQRAKQDRVEQYIDHWMRWFYGGLERLNVKLWEKQQYDNDTKQTKMDQCPCLSWTGERR